MAALTDPSDDRGSERPGTAPSSAGMAAVMAERPLSAPSPASSIIAGLQQGRHPFMTASTRQEVRGAGSRRACMCVATCHLPWGRAHTSCIALRHCTLFNGPAIARAQAIRRTIAQRPCCPCTGGQQWYARSMSCNRSMTCVPLHVHMPCNGQSSSLLTVQIALEGPAQQPDARDASSGGGGGGNSLLAAGRQLSGGSTGGGGAMRLARSKHCPVN